MTKELANEHKRSQMQANGDVAAGVRFPPTLGVRRLPMRPPILRMRCSSISSKLASPQFCVPVATTKLARRLPVH
jgi:hypothetical protein